VINLKISVLIATHKPYRQPADSIYTPVHAGKKGKTSIGFIGDDTGDNISGKNPNYCELTVLYWGWKNVNVDFLGLVHYRRHFIYREYIACYLFGKWKSILTSNHLKKLLCRSPIILPNKRCYYIETNESHYKHAHVCEPLDKTRQIISELYPEYLGFFEGVMNRTWAHMFNMLIMRKDILNDYCSWLFSILFELEKRIDISGYSVYESRVFGYISELLLDVWLDKNRYQGLECNVMFMENQHWPTKIYYFLVRKLKSDLLKEISN
jgi:hypothetical protein